MGFSKKAGGKATGSSDFDATPWNEWSEHLHETFPMKKELDRGNGKGRKTKNLVGIVNYIQELGTPPAADSQWKVKDDHVAPADGEEYSQYELDYIEEQAEKGRSVDFIWTKQWDDKANKGKGGMATRRVQTSPQYNQEEWGVAIDFPQWIVDFAKHPKAPEGCTPRLRPMRISLNGMFNGEIQKPILFEVARDSGEVRPTNILRKIAIAAGIDEDLRESEWDIAELAGATCNFKATSDITRREDGRVFHNAACSTPSAVEDFENPETEEITTAEDQIAAVMRKAGDKVADFTGVLLDMAPEDYTDEVMNMVVSTGFANGFNARAEQSESFEIHFVYKEGHEKAGEAGVIEKGVDYKTTPFAIALEKFLKKKDAQNKKAGKSASKASQGDSDKSSKPEAAKSKPDAKTPPPKSEGTPSDASDEGLDDDDEEDLDLPF
ncbi:hypothetical protein NVP1121O_065 [Vibrio phage 1.121.O._10N.286.46.C4]|nr:hypothetical protein NVP1121O_065 [Vibrio phage 1.121.O._10N.286.46.C4]